MTEQKAAQQLSAMLRSHVEQALKLIWAQSDLEVDADGDYPFRSETAACWVHVHHCEEPLVRVFAFAAHSVPTSKRMLREVNDLNQRARWAKVSWHDGLVVVDQVIHWTEVDVESLQRAIDSVTGVADDVGLLFAGVFGGETPFSADLADDDAAA